MSLSKSKKLMAAGLTAITLGGAIVTSAAPAEAGYYGGRYYRHRGNGGALAAGVIGGLAVGALAATAARPAYGYPAYGYPAYGPAYYGGGCYIVKRRFVNEWGDLVIRREQVCE